MNDTDIVTISCAAIVVLAVIAVAVFLFGRKAFTYKKGKEGANTCLTIYAKRNLAKVVVVARFGGEEIKFERKRIRKDQSVDFVFPSSEKKIKLVIEAEPGNEHHFEI